MSLALRKNSPDGQLQEMGEAFATVREKAQDYERHEKNTKAKLYAALGGLYEFGEDSRSLMGEHGKSLTEHFILAHGGKWTKPVQSNPYVGLLNLAFTGLSAPLKSQYAQVLLHAHRTNIAPGEFEGWLSSGNGIKGRLEEATALTSSTARQINERAKLSRLDNARATLAAGPRSNVVALPMPTQHKGFATVLVEIDGNNNASILRLVDTEISKIDPLLLKLIPGTGSNSDALADLPLGRLHRAIDLILGLVDVKSLRNAHISIENRMERGSTATAIQIVTETYIFAGASMRLAGHVPALPVSETFLLDIASAATFRDCFARYEDWSITASSDAISPYTLTTTTPSTLMLPLISISAGHSFRCILQSSLNVPLAALDQETARSIIAFIDCWRDDAARANKHRKIQRRSPNRLRLEFSGDDLQIVRDDAPNIVITLLGNIGHRPFVEPRWLGISDVERLCRMLDKYETGAIGWLIDTDVADAGLHVRVEFPTKPGPDQFDVIIPTVISNSMHYAQTCRDMGSHK